MGGDGLRDLAQRIYQAAKEHPEMSRAGRAVHACIDNIALMARLSDLENHMPETEEERKLRTGLSSVNMTNEESKKVQKTPNRVDLQSILRKIQFEETIHPTIIPHMTLCVLKLENGYVVVGKSAPADPANFDAELGKKFAKEDAIRQIWQLEAYLLREKMVFGKVE